MTEPSTASLVQADLYLMDGHRPVGHTMLTIRRLGAPHRLVRAAGRFGMVAAAGGAVALIPLMHLCGALVVLLAAPVVAFMAWRPQVLTTTACTLACPQCKAPVTLPPGATGWPVQVHCEACGITMSARPTP